MRLAELKRLSHSPVAAYNYYCTIKLSELGNNYQYPLNLLRYYTLAVFYQGSVSKIFDNGVYVFKSHTSQIKNSFLQFGRQISTGIRSC